jgi:hypothetical protein
VSRNVPACGPSGDGLGGGLAGKPNQDLLVLSVVSVSLGNTMYTVLHVFHAGLLACLLWYVQGVHGT